MRFFYSPSTGGFYIDVLHGDAMPADKVEITEQRYQALLAEQEAGKTIQPGDDGAPVALTPVMVQP